MAGQGRKTKMARNMKRIPVLDHAVQTTAYQYLYAQEPTFARAVEQAVGEGEQPSEIGMYILRETGRERLAKTCEQAARLIAGSPDLTPIIED